MPIYKRCGRCGRRIPSGTTCPCLKQSNKERYKLYDRQSRDPKSTAFYRSKEYLMARDEALTLDGGIDVYLFATTGEIKPADTAHHIIPLKDDWGKRADVGNLMSLHHDTHSHIESLYKKDKAGMEQILAEMLKKHREESEWESLKKRKKYLKNLLDSATRG